MLAATAQAAPSFLVGPAVLPTRALEREIAVLANRSPAEERARALLESLNDAVDRRLVTPLVDAADADLDRAWEGAVVAAITFLPTIGSLLLAMPREIPSLSEITQTVVQDLVAGDEWSLLPPAVRASALVFSRLLSRRVAAVGRLFSGPPVGVDKLADELAKSNLSSEQVLREPIVAAFGGELVGIIFVERLAAGFVVPEKRAMDVLTRAQRAARDASAWWYQFVYLTAGPVVADGAFGVPADDDAAAWDRVASGLRLPPVDAGAAP